MTSDPQVILDHRDADEVFRQLVERRLGFVPEWLAREGEAATAVAHIFGRYMEAVLRRLNQAPGKNKLAFFDLLNIGLVPAQAARAPVTFSLAQGANDITAPSATQLAASAAGGRQVVFETERAVAIAAAALVRAVSLCPGRDQYVDHTAELSAAQRFRLFDPAKLTGVPHAIYLAHSVLLALADAVTLEVQFDLSQPGAVALPLRWEYWDGNLWRGFKDLRPACAAKGAPMGDSTAGLTESGRYLLQTDCAESAKREVNGSKNYWIRGVLDEPLVPATGTDDKILPEAESIRISSTINHPLDLSADMKFAYTTSPKSFFGLPQSAQVPRLATLVRIVNEGGEYVPNVLVEAAYNKSGTFVRTSIEGEDVLVFPQQQATDTGISLTLTYQGLTVQTIEVPAGADLAILITLQLRFLPLDQAFSDGTAIDLTKPFFPFGQQPGPGSTFYFSNATVFSKPRAQFRLFFARTKSPQDSIAVGSNTYSPVPLVPTVAWEYWNGRDWQALLTTQTQTMDETGAIDFTVPDDLEPIKVNDVEALWMRARVVSGTFGFTQTVGWTAGTISNSFSYVVVQPPAVSSIGLGYSWRYGPFIPEQVLTENYFRFIDRTYETRWPGYLFPIFERVPDTTPAFYLGFDKKLPSDSNGLFLDLVEDPDTSKFPPMIWEYWTGADWRKLSFEDETRNLALPGILNFIGAEDARDDSFFGEKRFWIRGRLKEDEPPPQPVINRIYTNTVWASERRTLINVPLGASAGIADQTFLITQTPVLEGEQIEVRELAGARANVEWRILARELSTGDTRLMQTLEQLLAREGTETEVQYGPLRLRRDREHRVIEAWVRWESTPTLSLCGPADRVYALDRARGVLAFGGPKGGMIPPAGALIRVAQMQSGGGTPGNVIAGAIAQLLGPLAGVQSVTNPKPAEGGADRESMELYRDRAPRNLRHRGRAITLADYETMAREASPAVGFVRAIPNRNDGGRPVTGWVTLIIIPESADPRPYPSFGLREHVEHYLLARMPADVAALNRLHVTGPQYLPVDVSATISPIDPSEAGLVEQRARAAIQKFLHPLRGGPEGRGWELGRDVYLSDLAAVIEAVEGLDYAEDVRLLLDGVPKGETLPVADGRMVVAGTVRLKVRAAERQKALLLSAGRTS